MGAGDLAPVWTHRRMGCFAADPGAPDAQVRADRRRVRWAA